MSERAYRSVKYLGIFPLYCIWNGGNRKDERRANRSFHDTKRARNLQMKTKCVHTCHWVFPFSRYRTGIEYKVAFTALRFDDENFIRITERYLCVRGCVSSIYLDSNTTRRQIDLNWNTGESLRRVHSKKKIVIFCWTTVVVPKRKKITENDIKHVKTT